MRKYLAAAACAAAIGFSHAAEAHGYTTMREGDYALAPFSFVKFCLDYPSECPKSADSARIDLTANRMAELDTVNHEVNASIRPTPDRSNLRYWRLNVTAGDCNNFAIKKRHELIERGWPAAALALTVAKTKWGEGHLVVTVRTYQGDFVLDNLRPNIVSWEDAGYQWIMRQSERNPQYWANLRGGEVGEDYAARGQDDDRKAASLEAPAEGPGKVRIALGELASAENALAVIVSSAEIRAGSFFTSLQPKMQRLEGEAMMASLSSAANGAMQKIGPTVGEALAQIASVFDPDCNASARSRLQDVAEGSHEEHSDLPAYGFM
jgi:predicted transglutaminase-like cysteine proteinase